VKRFGQLIKVKPEKLAYYKQLHANCWPAVLRKIRECNIRNFSIFHRDGCLFSYFEYVGTDFEADMAAMAADPETQRWWKETDPCQEPLDPSVTSHYDGPWWSDMQRVFHTD
jgi:L-rhamnose mutarotase